MQEIDTGGMTPVDLLAGHPDEEFAALIPLAQEAEEFLRGQRWCAGIARGFVDRGWEGVLAVCYFELAPSSLCPVPGVWVIAGDIPPAYMDVESCRSGAQALASYCRAMRDWVMAVRTAEPTSDLIPVFYRGSLRLMEPTPTNADMLAKRLRFIERHILPLYSGGS